MKINKSLLFATLLAAFSQTIPMGIGANGKIYQFGSGNNNLDQAVPMISMETRPIPLVARQSQEPNPLDAIISPASDSDVLHEALTAFQGVTSAHTTATVKEAVQPVAGTAALAKAKNDKIQAKADELKNQTNHNATHKAIDDIQARLDKKELAEKEMMARMAKKHHEMKAQLNRIEAAVNKNGSGS